MIKPPVFILCHSRSGSTLLRYILDTHPAICCPPEIHLGQILAALMNVYKHTLCGVNDDISEEQLNSCAMRHAKKDLVHILRRYVQAKGKVTWAEKSVYTVDLLPLIRSAFPAARYICLYRNCADFVSSAVETTEHSPDGALYGFSRFIQTYPDNRIKAYVAYWHEKVSKIIFAQNEIPDQCHAVRYEDLVLNTDATLSGMFTFLGESWSQDLTHSVFSSPHDAGPGDHKIQSSDRISADSVGKGKTLNLQSLPGEWIERVNALSRKLGYEPIAT